eukprot:scaffold539_cov145-Skeletonema_menzelii.AAC.13
MEKGWEGEFDRRFLSPSHSPQCSGRPVRVRGTNDYHSVKMIFRFTIATAILAAATQTAAFAPANKHANIGKEVFATTFVAVFVWAWNLVSGGYEDFSGVMHDPLIASKWATEIGLPLTIFTTLSPSLGLLLGE